MDKLFDIELLAVLALWTLGTGCDKRAGLELGAAEAEVTAFCEARRELLVVVVLLELIVAPETFMLLLILDKGGLLPGLFSLRRVVCWDGVETSCCFVGVGELDCECVGVRMGDEVEGDGESEDVDATAEVTAGAAIVLPVKVLLGVAETELVLTVFEEGCV